MTFAPETEWIEYKKTTGEMKEGIVSLSSMLNKNGYGTLYFGIRDNGEIIGQQMGERTLREISQAIANFIRPQIIPTITHELKDGKDIIKIYAEGSDKPYSAYGRYYIRSADEDRELSPEQLRLLLLKKSELDPIVKMPSVTQDLTFGQLKTLYAIKGLTVNEHEFESNLGLHTESGSFNYMAEILADINDVSLKVVTFSGKDKSEVIGRNEYGFKCLLTAMDQVISYVESINGTRIKLSAHQREEEHLLDILSFREAWINACLHTKWEKKNPPAVYIFSNRIEIISTGGLPADLTQDEFFRGISKPVNQKLQKIFGQLGYVEQTGHGIPQIIKHYGMQAFDISPNFVNVILPFREASETKESADRTVPVTLNPAQNAVYSLIGSNPSCTIKDMVRETNLSDGYVRKILQQLRSGGYIERIGANKNGYWRVI